MSYTYKYPQPSITCDVIVWDRRGDRVLLIKRKHAPFKDCWAIVGGFFNAETHAEGQMDESIRDAAIRELKEEVNIDYYADKGVNAMKQPLEGKHKYSISFLCIQDKPGRDPRGRVITMVYVLTIWDGVEGIDIKAQDDAAEVRWFQVRDVLEGKVALAFDHLDSIRMVPFTYTPFAGSEVALNEVTLIVQLRSASAEEYVVAVVPEDNTP